MSAQDRLDRAFEACCSGERAALAQLRCAVEPLLIARLAAFTDDADIIQASIDDAFGRMDPAAIRKRQINWRVWLIATALASFAERAGHTTWLDARTPASFMGSALERRGLLLCVILTLEQECVWRLLRCLPGQSAHQALANACLLRLNQRLARIRAGPNPPGPL